MGLDSWTRTPQEREYKERARKHEKDPPSSRVSLKEKARRKLSGEGTCACGCKQPATAFRGGKMYNRKCVGPGSGWDKSGLPQDRTPPRKMWKKKR